jgi:hypothetical protein
MKVCTHKGLVIAVLTRGEHCPPHVHVGTPRWDARFQFSFWNNNVWLWDVTPEKTDPTVGLLEDLRQAIKEPKNLRCAREHWWNSRQTVCLNNQQWDGESQEVVSPKTKKKGAKSIISAHFDLPRYRTFIELTAPKSIVEIAL